MRMSLRSVPPDTALLTVTTLTALCLMECACFALMPLSSLVNGDYCLLFFKELMPALQPLGFWFLGRDELQVRKFSHSVDSLCLVGDFTHNLVTCVLHPVSPLSAKQPFFPLPGFRKVPSTTGESLNVKVFGFLFYFPNEKSI